ncbi:unnamed protein product, partial [Phaeothamnion confervicola]
MHGLGLGGPPWLRRCRLPNSRDRSTGSFPGPMETLPPSLEPTLANAPHNCKKNLSMTANWPQVKLPRSSVNSASIALVVTCHSTRWMTVGSPTQGATAFRAPAQIPDDVSPGVQQCHRYFRNPRRTEKAGARERSPTQLSLPPLLFCPRSFCFAFFTGYVRIKVAMERYLAMVTARGKEERLSRCRGNQ